MKLLLVDTRCDIYGDLQHFSCALSIYVLHASLISKDRDLEILLN